MSAFTDFSGIRPDGLGCYELTAELVFEIGREGSGFVYRVPAGFRFNVSIPAPARIFFNPNDYRYLKAAALHDHMWVTHWDRQTAAAVFYRALRASFVPAWRAVVMYLAVSSFSLFCVDQTAE